MVLETNNAEVVSQDVEWADAAETSYKNCWKFVEPSEVRIDETHTLADLNVPTSPLLQFKPSAQVYIATLQKYLELTPLSKEEFLSQLTTELVTLLKAIYMHKAALVGTAAEAESKYKLLRDQATNIHFEMEEQAFTDPTVKIIPEKKILCDALAKELDFDISDIDTFIDQCATYVNAVDPDEMKTYYEAPAIELNSGRVIPKPVVSHDTWYSSHFKTGSIRPTIYFPDYGSLHDAAFGVMKNKVSMQLLPESTVSPMARISEAPDLASNYTLSWPYEPATVATSNIVKIVYIQDPSLVNPYALSASEVNCRVVFMAPDENAIFRPIDPVSSNVKDTLAFKSVFPAKRIKTFSSALFRSNNLYPPDKKTKGTLS